MRLPRFVRVLSLLAAVLTAALCLSACGGKAVAFTVDGLGVEKAELVHYMQENAAVVAADLENNEGLDSFADGFWTDRPGGIDTFARLREYTERQIVRQKTEQLCAKAHGIDTPLTYSEQLAAMEENNRQRAAAYAAGEVLYGPIERDFVGYFSEFYSAMRLSCRDALINDGTLKVTQAQIDEYYMQHRADFSEESEESARLRIREYLFDLAYESHIDTLAAQAKIEEGGDVPQPEDVF